MASFRDLAIGAVLSGAVTFGTTWYFGEREHQRRMEESAAALEQAREQVALQARQARTAELFARWTSAEYVQHRSTLERAIAARPDDSMTEWETSSAANAADTAAMENVLRFYAELGVQMRAGQLDDSLVKGLFEPNVQWWVLRALPSLCRNYPPNGTIDRFNGALLAFEQIAGRGEEGCPSFVGRPPPLAYRN